MAAKVREGKALMDWSVRIEMEGPARKLDPDTVTDALELLQPYSAVASLGGAALGIRLSAEAPSAVAAEKFALKAVSDALKTVGLPEWPVVGVAASTTAELLRELDQPTVAPLVGVSESAAILGVSKQRITELAKGRSFPVPIARLASGPVWFAATIRHFNDTWDRRPGPKAGR